MIELPADLTEVLTVVQRHENGAGIAFPDADEDHLTELAEAWESWNTSAEPRIRAIVASAQQAMAQMSGEAADAFHRYLERYSGRDDAHAVTTLETGLVMARCLRGAAGTVAQAKTTMAEQLRFTKQYLDSSLPGAAPEVAARSEGVRLTVDSCKHHAGQASADMDAMLRRSADRIERMNGAGQVCALDDTGARGSVAAGAFASAEVPGRQIGSACSASPGLSLAGFSGAFTSADGPGPVPADKAADLPGASGGASSGVLGAAVAGVGVVGGAAGRRPAAGGLSGRALAGSMPTSASAGLDGRSRTVPSGGQSPPQAARQSPGSGPGTGAGVRAGSGAAAARAGTVGRGPVFGGLPGAGHGKGKKGARSRRGPGLVTEEAPEQDEVLTDSGILGQAGDAPVGDRQAQRARQRWLDDARTGTVGERRAEAPQAPAEEKPPVAGGDLLTELTSVVLGPEPAGEGRTKGAATGAGAGAAGGQTEARSVAEGAGLEPLRATTLRRPGEPDQGMDARASTQIGPEAATKRAPLREEGGYRVPSPHLRAAMGKLAASGAFDRPAPASAPQRPSATQKSPQQ